MDKNDETVVTIEFQEPLDGESISDIQELTDLIGSNPGLDVCGSGGSGPNGAKPVLTTTLAVIGAVTGVTGLVLQAVGIWKQGKPKYSITITEADRTYTVDNLTCEQYLSTLQRLNRSTANTRISIKVSPDRNT